MLTLRQLRYLSALARFEHFGRAAEDCAITQPALSMQIRDLELHLGVALVERRPGEVRMTDAGREIARRGDEVLAAARDLQDFARQGVGVLNGRLRLGVIPSLAPYLLPRILPELQARYPELRLELRERQTRQLLDEVKSGSLDAALLALPVDERDLEAIDLFRDLFLLAVPADDPRPDHALIAAEDIDVGKLLLLEDGHCLRDQALAFCTVSKAGADVARGGFAASSLNTVMQMVAGGFGITLIPQIAADVERRDSRIRLLRMADPEPGRTIGLVSRRSSPRKADFAALGDVVKGCMCGAEPDAADASSPPPHRQA